LVHEKSISDLLEYCLLYLVIA